ncbi:DNA-binding domain-containing protein [Sphingomonas sp. TREG-RG-20F-R18-01]|uniref:HvfC/BufC N-terminal domain-containing protein n=1 Tax=Sphingomonas sp. TREG-RG-20F-R18-01 TaxID=2914982 RepID=UPI001F58F03D|nr:DNA-binding domain-containing protein [Sphingomonas sp. TREG-RG-20F-R18-01]
MSELADFQERFAVAIVAEPSDEALAALPGFAVYRNTSLSAAIDALAANYPRIEALLGPAAFSEIALEYTRAYRPDTPLLATYGTSFAAYLDAHPIRTELPYLADVARIDRMWTEAFFAVDAPPLSAESFAAIDLGAEPDRVLALHPASRHAWFDSPAAAIWLAHQEDMVEPIDIAWLPSGVHLTRAEFTIVVEAVPKPDILFLDLLNRGVPVVESAERLLTACPDADLAAIVARLLSRGALEAFLS